MNPLKGAFKSPASLAACLALLVPPVLADGKRSVRLEGLIPDDAIGYARFAGWTGKVEALLESELADEVASNPLFQAVPENRQVRAAWKRLREIREATGHDPLKLLGDVFRREVAIGLFLDFSGLQGVLLARFDDGRAARDFVKRLRETVASATGHPLEGSTSEYLGETIETLDSSALTVIGDVLALSGDAGLLESVIDLRAGKTTRSVLHSKTFKPVVEDDGRMLFQLALRPNFLPAVRLPEKLDSLWSFVLGGWLGALRASDLLSLDLDVGDGRLVLRCSAHCRGEDLGETYGPWFPRDLPGGSGPTPLVERGLAVVRLHRHLASWWSNRDAVVVQKAVEGMETFGRHVSVAFGGRSFEEILGEIGSPLTLVARRQAYAGELPEPAIPAFAAVLPLARATEFKPVLLAAFQRLVGLAGLLLSRGDAPVRLLLQIREIDGTEYYCVDVRSPGEAGTPGVIENLSPCLVFEGEHAILSSTVGLAEQLSRDLRGTAADGPEAGPTGGGRAHLADSVSLDVAALRQALEDNVEVLVRRTRRESRVSVEEAEGRIRAVISLLGLADRLRLSGVESRDFARLRLEISLSDDGGRPTPSAR